MKLVAHIREAYLNLLSAKLRSFLAILGVLVGTASVVALVSGGQLATEHALSQFKRLGTDLLSATIQDTSRRGETVIKTLNQDNLDDILGGHPGVLAYSPYAIDFSPVSFEGVRQQSNVVGITENLADIMKVKVASGRFISDFDGTQRFCVVGGVIAQKMVGPGRDTKRLIGQQIQSGQNFYTVVGVLEESGENMFFLVNLNKSILVPLDAALQLNKYAKINNIVFKLAPSADLQSMKADISASLHVFDPAKRLFFRSPQEIITSMQSQNRTFTLLLGFIGSIALVVGGIGVMNIMLVSVVERRREIGIRLAVGARGRDILLMFLSESIALTLFGGLLGVFFGELIAFLTAHFSGWHYHLYFMPLLVGFGVSALVGMFFGIYPAYQASKSDPIACLRSE